MKLPKINTSAVRGVLGSEIVYFLLYGAIVWLCYFIATEVVISGGLNERNPYLAGFGFIVIIASAYVTYRNTQFNGWKSSLIKSGLGTIAFALLDFLIFFLIFESKDAAMYKFWATYVDYALMLLAPVIVSILRTRSIAQTRNTLLTNLERTL